MSAQDLGATRGSFWVVSVIMAALLVSAVGVGWVSNAEFAALKKQIEGLATVADLRDVRGEARTEAEVLRELVRTFASREEVAVLRERVASQQALLDAGTPLTHDVIAMRTTLPRLVQDLVDLKQEMHGVRTEVRSLRQDLRRQRGPEQQTYPGTPEE